MTVPEAELKKTDAGLIPQGEGWFVLNARDASWIRSEERGQDTDFEGGQEWTQLGFRIQVLAPGQRGMYHGERGQEDFLVVSGECLLVIEGEERRLKAWDFVHCPPWTRHVFVGAGDGPCVIVMVGSRVGGFEVVYAGERGCGEARCERARGDVEARTRPTPAGARRSGRLRRGVAAGLSASRARLPARRSKMKRHPALIPLLHDHHAKLVQARRLRLAAGSDVPEARAAAAKEYVSAFFTETASHLRVEEEQLFPLLVRHAGGSPLLERVLNEHGELRGLASALREEVAAGDVSAGPCCSSPTYSMHTYAARSVSSSR